MPRRDLVVFVISEAAANSCLLTFLIISAGGSREASLQ